MWEKRQRKGRRGRGRALSTSLLLFNHLPPLVIQLQPSGLLQAPGRHQTHTD